MTTNRRPRQRGPGPVPPRTPRPAARTPRPLPKGSTLFTPDASPARQAAERRSAQPLMYLYQLPRWVPPIVMVVLLVAGLTVRGPVGGILLVGVAAVLGWLAAISWPRASASTRAARVIVMLILLAVAGWQATR